MQADRRRPRTRSATGSSRTSPIVDDAGREVARLLTSPFSTGAIPFMSTHVHITTPPTAFVSIADSARLEDGMRVRVKIGGRFVPGRRERNVIADIPGRGDGHVIVSAHYDSVWRGPGAIDNATGVEGVRRVGEALTGRELEHGVRLIAFAAEEIKLTGSRYYVDEANLRDELDEVLGVVNLDCIGHGEKLEILASPDALLGRAVEAARSLGLLDRLRARDRAGNRRRRLALVRREEGPGRDDPPLPVRRVPPAERVARARRRAADGRRGRARGRTGRIAAAEADPSLTSFT